VAGGLTFVSISAGGTSRCGLTKTGAGYCWGDNDWGQLGNGTDTATSVPVAVAAGLTFASISVGEQTACGVTTEGAAYCWGQNLVGELGIGTLNGPEQCAGDYPTDPTIPCSHVPVRVAGGMTFRLVKVSYRTVCGLTTSGRAYCWGANNAGMLGVGVFQGPDYCPPNAQRGSPCVPSPVPVVGDLSFVALDVGGSTACGVVSTGAAFCWGQNASGALGDGTQTSSASPALVAGGLTFASISTNGVWSCGVTTGHEAYCWGAVYGSLTGALGNGTTTGSLVPVKVARQP
jgi:alpha-tubulin suppressor-like RCC1 family protein